MQNILPQEEFQQQEKNQESSYFLVIPAHLAEDDNLNHRQILLFAHLTGLSNKDGYSYASNEYLMKKVKVSEAQIQKDLKFLEDCGYIRRQIIKNGMYTSRKIYITYAFSKNSYEYAQERIPTPPAGGVRHLCTEAHKEEEEKKEELEEKDLLRRCKKKEAVASSDAKASSPTNQKKRFIDHVFLTDGEYQKLVNEFGEAKAKVYIKRLDAYIGSKGKKYKSHYKTILSWSLKDEKDGDRARESEKSDPRNHPLKGRSFVTINGKRTEVTHEKRKLSDEV